MSVNIIEKWYHEGAPPIWKMECPGCKRIYHITEWQSFMCDCGKNQIDHEEYKPVDKKA